MQHSSKFELLSGVEEHHLENGLRILLKPVGTSNAVSVWIFYRVGSRNESPGITGVSHWCEHMLFKGGGKLGKGEVHTLVSNEGGRNNAFTDQDLTAYYETLPKESLELGLFIESERMTNSAFDPKEVSRERQVIISEREGAENYPTYQLREELLASAYRIHPYRYPVVGWKSDLGRITQEDLYSHYKKYYHPSNATLVVCGKFDSNDALALIRKHFGSLKSQSDEEPRTETLLIEPDQQGERTSRLVRAGTLDYLAAGFHVPAILDGDMPALIVLSTVLGGWRGLIGFSIDRFVPRSNRLYKILVEGNLASEVSTYFPINIDPGLLYFEVTILPGVRVAEVRNKLLSIFEKISDVPPDEDEMRVAFNQIRSWHAYENDGVALHAQSLGLFETIASRSLADELVANCFKISPEDLQRVAKKYLAERNRTICTYESSG